MLSWWIEGLRFPLPAHLQARMLPVKTPVPVHIHDGLYTLAGSVRSVTHASLASALAHFDSEYNPETQFPVACLDEAILLVKHLQLPKVSARQLASLVKFELQRVLPFPLAEVRYSHFVNDAGKKPHVGVTVVIVPTASIQHFLEESRSLRREIPLVVSSEGKMLPVDLQASPGTRLQTRYTLPLRPWHAALLLLALFLHSAIPYFYFAGKAEQLGATTATNRERAVLLREEISAQVSSRGEDAFVSSIESKYFSPLNAMRSLTELLPEDTWLQALALGGGRAQLQGESPSAAETLAQIESADFLEQAEFQSPVAPSHDGLNEQFHIIARLVPDNGL